MIAISLWNPWSYLWLLPGEKTFETRSWYSAHRGPLLVHAAKARNPDVRAALGDPYIQSRLAAHGLNVCDLAYGALIGTVELIGCSRMDRMPEPNESERLVGNWSPERFAWERGPRVQIFENPIPYVGRQGFFEVPYAVIAHELLAPVRAKEAKEF
jgi:activating signal cointegrator 1